MGNKHSKLDPQLDKTDGSDGNTDPFNERDDGCVVYYNYMHRLKNNALFKRSVDKSVIIENNGDFLCGQAAIVGGNIELDSKGTIAVVGKITSMSTVNLKAADAIYIDGNIEGESMVTLESENGDIVVSGIVSKDSNVTYKVSSNGKVKMGNFDGMRVRIT